jgi:zinc transporter 1
LRSCLEHFRTALVPWYCRIFYSYFSLFIVRVSEHGHSHSHGHSHGDKDNGPIPHSDGIPAVTDNMPMQNIPVRGRTGSYSSMYGHPAATRAAVTQAAQDMATASPTQHRRSTSRSSRSIRVELRGSLEANVTETPNLDYEQQKIEPSTASPLPNGHSHGHSHGSMNMRALVLHVMGDALGNIGVIVTGLVIWLTTWSGRFYLDPATSLVITVIIFTSALPLGISL